MARPRYIDPYEMQGVFDFDDAVPDDPYEMQGVFDFDEDEDPDE